MQQTARKTDELRILKRSLAAWTLRIAGFKASEACPSKSFPANQTDPCAVQKILARKSHAMAVERDIATLRSAFDVWIMAYSGGVMKQTKEYSEMRQVWNRWRSKMATHEALMGKSRIFAYSRGTKGLHSNSHPMLPVQARTVADKYDVQSARSALRKWKHRAAEIQCLQSMAIDKDKHRLLSNGLQTFTKRVHRFKQLEEGAIMTNTFFKLRTCFQAWQQALRIKTQTKWIADKRKRDTKEIFDGQYYLFIAEGDQGH
jgi:hypothetical protein